MLNYFLLKGEHNFFLGGGGFGMQHSLWDLSSQTRDWTQALDSEGTESSTPGPPEKKPLIITLDIKSF